MERVKIYFGKLLWRFRLPPSLWFFHRNLSAQKALIRYLSAPEIFWHSAGSLRAMRTRNCVQAFIDAGAESSSNVAALLLNRSRELQPTRCRPFFIMGFPASGSTWLGNMLGDLPGFCYGGEIGLPLAIRYWCHKLKRHKATKQEVFDLIYAIMLLQSWGLNDPEKIFDCEFINSATSIFNYDIYKEIWPEGRYIFLVRDPRDQLLSLTYRKKNRRQRLSFKGNDLDFLRFNALETKSIYERYKLYKKENGQDIYEIKYEVMKQNTIEEVKKILNQFQIEVPDNIIAKIIYENDAQNMRSGVVKHRGNLDEGGISRDWRELLTEKEKRVLKPIIQEILEVFDYEKDALW